MKRKMYLLWMAGRLDHQAYLLYAYLHGLRMESKGTEITCTLRQLGNFLQMGQKGLHQCIRSLEKLGAITFIKGDSRVLSRFILHDSTEKLDVPGSMPPDALLSNIQPDNIYLKEAL